MHFHVASALRDTSSASQWNTTTTAPATVHHPVHLRLLFVPKLDYLLSFNSSKSIPPGLFFEQKQKIVSLGFLCCRELSQLLSWHFTLLVERSLFFVSRPSSASFFSHLIGFIPSGGFFQLLLHDLQVNYFIPSARCWIASQWQSTPQTSLAGFSSIRPIWMNVSVSGRLLVLRCLSSVTRPSTSHFNSLSHTTSIA